MLAFTRECLRLRRDHPALRTGSMRIVEAGPSMLVFERAAPAERLRCTFNLSNGSETFVPAGRRLFFAGEVQKALLGPHASIIEVIE